jgi:hypothetical protein
MKRLPFSVDLAMYGQAVPLLLRHPSIFVLPLLAAVVDLLIGQIAPFFTDAAGGAGGFLFQIIVQLVYGFSFGVAVIAANNVWRGRRATFDEAWDEGRRKAGGILIATIGFYFLVYVAGYVGQLGGQIVQIVLQLVVAFFLIYTIPAAAIGGMPGNFAIGASFRAVRANLLAAALLAIVFVALWIWLPYFATAYIPVTIGTIGFALVLATIKAIVLAYLAFPFAKGYDDVAFRGYW